MWYKKSVARVIKKDHKQWRRLLFIVFGLFFFIFLKEGWAGNQQIAIIRDAEIEMLVIDYAEPLLKAAGLHSAIEVILVDDQSFNAFVDGQRIFINVGTLIQAETPNQVIGVLAHEVGHLARGHLYRLREKLRQAQTFSVIGMLVGTGTSIVGVLNGNNQVGLAGSGIAAGSRETAMRILMQYQREDEIAADRLAISYLDKTEQSAAGLLRTFERFASSFILQSSTQVDPYLLTHPLPQQRIAAVKVLAAKSPYFKKRDSPILQHRHDRVRAKIAAFTGDKGFLQSMVSSSSRGIAARYGDAIFSARHGNPQTALKKINMLVADQPKDPYFRELLGDMLIRANAPSQAAKAYKKALEINKKGSGLIHVSYGRALLLTGNAENIALAIREIKKGIKKDPNCLQAYHFLAMAYAQQGKIALADLAMAEMHYHNGDYRQARIFSLRAVQGLVKNSAGWVQAQDLLKATEKKK